MKKRYLIAIEPGTDKTAWGVVVPDLPGCFSAGDTLAEAIANAPEAIELWLEGGDAETQCLPPEKHLNNPEFEGWLWRLVEADFSL